MTAVSATPHGPAQEQGGYPLSFVQERLWRIWRQRPDDSAYNVPLALELDGPLDRAALVAALDEIVARHEVLRTRFLEFGGEPRQVVDVARPVSLVVDDVSVLPPGERDKRLGQILDRHARHPFDLTSDLLLVARLVTLAATRHVLLMTVPHIVFDGDSVALLLAEVSTVYRARLLGEALLQAPPQYGPYCVRERSAESLARVRDDLGYWAAQLADLPSLDLPIDRPAGLTAAPEGGLVEFAVPADLLAGLDALGRQNRTTLYVVLLSAFQALLARYSRQTDFGVACGASYRGDVAADGVLGCFINTLVFRADCSGNPSFTGLVERTREVVVDGYAHQAAPFDLVVGEVDHERRERHPLARISLQVVANPEAYLDLPGVRATNLVPGMSGVHLDMQVQLMSRGDGLLGQVIYARNLFDRATVVRLMAGYVRLLRAVVDDPARTLADLPLLDDAEAVTLAAMRRGGDAPVSDDLVAMLLGVAERYPERVAVREDERVTTYRDLMRRTRVLAGQLRARRVGPGDVVGVLAEPGADTVAAMVAAWLVHAAYLPLDPEQPAAHHRTLVRDAGARVVVVGPNELFTPDLDAPAAVVAVGAAESASDPDGMVYRPINPGQLAYLRYTSGSTGRPKGVMVEHASLRNLTAVLGGLGYRTGGPLRVAVLAPLTFDASVKMVLALCFGHELVFIPRCVRRDSGQLLRHLERGRFDAMDCTPLDLRGLVTVNRKALRTLPPLVLVGGEAIELDLWHRMREAEETTFHNVYGPTECTVFVTAGQVREDEPTIGAPIVNTTVYVVDPWLNQVPVGVPGEILVGGAPIGRGYTGQPESTAGSFLPDPFGDQPGTRLYRTGDLARWRTDGRLEFIGRLDDQVKIRGHRVEPGEVRAALLRHDDVLDAEVVAWHSDHLGSRLVGYVVAEPSTAIDGDGLRTFLAGVLPEYLVPAFVVCVDAIPRSPNGKVDRRALPDPETARPSVASAYVAPRTAAERELAEVWQDVLGVDRIGVHDNFFELGGDSIASMQIAARAARRGLPLNSGDLFQQPTVAELAAAMTRSERDQR